MNLGPSRTLATSGTVFFVTLINGFQPWINVRKISVFDVVGVLDTSLHSIYEFLLLYSFVKVFVFLFL